MSKQTKSILTAVGCMIVVFVGLFIFVIGAALFTRLVAGLGIIFVIAGGVGLSVIMRRWQKENRALWVKGLEISKISKERRETFEKIKASPLVLRRGLNGVVREVERQEIGGLILGRLVMDAQSREVEGWSKEGMPIGHVDIGPGPLTMLLPYEMIDDMVGYIGQVVTVAATEESESGMWWSVDVELPGDELHWRRTNM